MKTTTINLMFLIIASIAWGGQEAIAHNTTFERSIDPPILGGLKHGWFAGAGAGIGLYHGDHNKQMKDGDRIAANFDFYAGKVLNDNFAIRAGINGFSIQGLTQNGSHSKGEYSKIPWEGYWLEKQSISYLYGHVDALYHLIGGHSDSDAYYGSVYNLYPYVGVGVMTTLGGSPSATQLSPNIGIYQTFGVFEDLALTLDIRGNYVGDSFDGEKGGRGGEGNLTINAGVVFNLNP